MFNLTVRDYATQLELWRNVVGYEDLYQVSNLGRVKRIKSGQGAVIGKILRQGITGGYSFVRLSRETKVSMFYVHRLVAFAFLGQPLTPEHEVNHINSIRNDNRVENLEWVTSSQNKKHAFKYGFGDHSGEKHPMAKLTWEKVWHIRELLKEGLLQREIASLYGVDTNTIGKIHRQESWVEKP